MIISAENNLLSVTVCVTNVIALVFNNSFNANRKNKMTINHNICAKIGVLECLSNSITGQNGLC